MVELKKGDLLGRDMFKSGSSSRGSWMMAKLKAEKGYDTLTIFVDNSDVQLIGNMVQVEAINSVKLTHRKYTKQDGAEAWTDDYQVNVTLVPYSEVPGFTRMDEDVPF